jgi:hypothetical protein
MKALQVIVVIIVSLLTGIGFATLFIHYMTGGYIP